MKNRKRLISILLATTMLVSLTACSGTGTAEDQTSITEDSTGETEETNAETGNGEELIPLKISHHPYIHALPSVYAEANGLYDMFDYTIDQYASGPVQNEAITSGAWEVGTTGAAGAILGASGYDMKIIGTTATETNVNAIYVRADSALANAEVDENGVYGTAADWRGLKILCQTGTTCHLVLIATLEYLGLSENDVEIIDTAVAQSFAAFKAGEADAVCLWSPFTFQAEDDEGWVKASSAKAMGIELLQLIVATKDAVENRPEVVAQWLEQYLKGCDGLREDLDAAAVMLYDFEQEEGISVTEEAAKREVEERPFPTLEENKAYFEDDGNGSCKAKEIMLMFADFMISQGKITEEDKQTMIDNNFVDGSFILGIDY